jgi:thiamine biosynthesis lipoprotein
MLMGVALAAGCHTRPRPADAPATQPAEAALKVREYKQIHMGVLARIVCYAPDDATAETACRAAYNRIAALEDIMSDYRPGSELSRLCRQAGGDPVPVSEELFYVLQYAYEISQRSAGTFDVTVGPYVKLWREARKTGVFPDRQKLGEAKALVGYNKMKLDREKRTVQLTVPGMKLDLGGIGKGYACDEALAELRRHGVNSALIEFGGELVCSDAPPGKPGWIIEVTNPQPGGMSKKIFVKNAGVSTSGDTEQGMEFEGRRYSHIVDPRTGIGLTNRLLVSVVAEKGITSDPLSKALSMLEPEMGIALAKSYGAKAYIREAE